MYYKFQTKVVYIIQSLIKKIPKEVIPPNPLKEEKLEERRVQNNNLTALFDVKPVIQGNLKIIATIR